MYGVRTIIKGLAIPYCLGVPPPTGQSEKVWKISAAQGKLQRSSYWYTTTQIKRDFAWGWHPSSLNRLTERPHSLRL